MSTSSCIVEKRDGSIQPFDVEKIRRYLTMISKDLKNIDVEYVIKIASLQFVKRITSKFILDVLINSTSNLISADTPDYQYVASRLLVNSVRREVWNSFLPKTTFEYRVRSRTKLTLDEFHTYMIEDGGFIVKSAYQNLYNKYVETYYEYDYSRMKYNEKYNIQTEQTDLTNQANIQINSAEEENKLNQLKLHNKQNKSNTFDKQHYLNYLLENAIDIYDPIIFKYYDSNDFTYFESKINYSRDLLLTLAGIRQFYDKYLIKDRITNRLYELPQEANMLISMYMFMTEPEPIRRELVVKMYDYLSTLKISLATPIYAGVRSKLRSFSSCCVLDCGDTADSILSTNYIIGKAVTKRYGIGVNINKIRGIAASVAKGQVVHTGIVPFLKMFAASTRGFMQNGIRGGQATISFPFWNWEVMTLLELKNNKGVEENRIRTMDYSIGLNRLFLERAVHGGDITLFSAEEVPLLTNDYTYTYEQFKSVYESYEQNNYIRKERINALELLKKIATERFETGRIYIYFMDNMNNFGVFKESIFSSNLCQEIALPTKPININKKDDDGLVGVCILSCVNVGRIDNWDDLNEACDIIVRFLDAMIDYQDYICPQIYRGAVEYRPLGIGISDFFHLLAKNKLKYDSVECRDFTHELAERFQYALLKSSNELAKRKGKCKEFEKSKYSDGILPIDNYKRSIDKNVSKVEYKCDWEGLRKDIKTYGLRNTCLSAIPPTASSCSISNSTPGIDPPRSIVVSKVSKYGPFKQVIPDILEYKDYYTLQRDIDNVEYFKLIGIIQKFIDQGISTNSFYMHDRDVSIQDVLKEITSAYSNGMKSLYYLNSNKGTDKDISRAMSCDGISYKNSVNSNNDDGKNSMNNKNDNETIEDEDEGCEGGACKL